MKKYNVYLFWSPLFNTCLFTLVFFSSCKKYLEIPVPQDQVVSATVFGNDNTANAAMNGLYSYMMSSPLTISSGGLSLFTGLSADELDNTIALPLSDDQFHSNNLLPNNETIQNNFWNTGFKIVYHCNTILDGLSETSSVSRAVSIKIKAQAKFIRAFSFFSLTNLFGDIPMPVTSNYIANSMMPRSSVEEVYVQIVEDLLDCIQLFEQSTITDMTGFPSACSARALLARVYLYNKDWEKAGAMASSVINSGRFSLAIDVSNVFTADSPEGILQIWPVSPGMNTWDASFFIPPDGETIPRYVITQSLADAFEAGDLRRQNWIGLNHVNGAEYLYPLKYKQVYSDPPVENYFVLRLSEQYLIRAEARTRLGNFTDACLDLNVIRSRSDLPSVSIHTMNELLDALLHERQTELFCEWGHRWFDLKRFGKADQVLSATKSNWQPFAQLYPIPLEEIKANPSLTQNEGY